MKLMVLVLIACAGTTVIAGCGIGESTDAVAPPPKNPNAPVSGSLRVFTYEDTTAPELMEPFEEQNPDLEVKTASFASDEEAAAKLNAGFQADVVESCLDEMSPLTEEGLLRPLDPAGVPEWDNLSFTDAPGVTEDGKTWLVPLSAGPQGLIVDTEKVPTCRTPGRRSSTRSTRAKRRSRVTTSCPRSPRRRWRWGSPNR